MPDESFEEALARLERSAPDIAQGINELVETCNSPGYQFLMKYLEGLADVALTELVKANPLDSDEIMRLQNDVKRFRWFATAPDQLAQTEFNRETVEEQQATVYED